MASPWDDAVIRPRPEDFDLSSELAFRKDLRRGGAWLEFAALRAAQVGLGALPAPVLRPVLAGFARLARRVDRRHTRAARAFLATAFPEADEAELERRVLASYRHLARVAVECDRLPRLIGARLGDHFEVETCEGLEEVVAGGGCLVLTAHVGLWEAVALPLLAMGYPGGVAVGKPPNNQHLARWIQRRREALGGVALPRDGAVQGVTAAVRAGGAAILLLDQRPRQGRKSVRVELFGRPAACDRSAGVLVRRVRAPMVVAGCYLTDRPGRYRQVFQRVVRPEELAGLSPEEVMALVNRETEALVRRAPDQYFWLHDRFKGAPESAGDGSGTPRIGR